MSTAEVTPSVRVARMNEVLKARYSTCCAASI